MRSNRFKHAMGLICVVAIVAGVGWYRWTYPAVQESVSQVAQLAPPPAPAAPEDIVPTLTIVSTTDLQKGFYAF